LIYLFINFVNNFHNLKKKLWNLIAVEICLINKNFGFFLSTLISLAIGFQMFFSLQIQLILIARESTLTNVFIFIIIILIFYIFIIIIIFIISYILHIQYTIITYLLLLDLKQQIFQL
jgi:hypothetical protein